MKTVKVIFENPIYNYSTVVNPKCSERELRKYFVNQYFSVECYPVENLQKCINIEIS